MRKFGWYPVIYMFIVTAFFSSIVIGFAQLTRERVEANKQLAFEKAALSVIPGLYDDQLGSLGIHEKFVAQVNMPDKLSATACTIREDERIVAYIVPISGQGFWAPIKGVVGLQADKKTITGIAFYEQNETPGLGAEITKPQFRNQFKGKVLAVGRKLLNIKPAASELTQNDVHAVTGATQTSIRLEQIINTSLKNWLDELAQGHKIE